MAVNVKLWSGTILEFPFKSVDDEIEKWENLGFDIINLDVFSKSGFPVAKIIETKNPWGCSCNERGVDEVGFECDKCDFHTKEDSFEYKFNLIEDWSRDEC